MAFPTAQAKIEFANHGLYNGSSLEKNQKVGERAYDLLRISGEDETGSQSAAPHELTIMPEENIPGKSSTDGEKQPFQLAPLSRNQRDERIKPDEEPGRKAPCQRPGK